MPNIQQIPVSNQMPTIEHKRHSLPVNDKKNYKEQMPHSKKKRHPLLVNDTKIPAKDQIPDSEQNRPTFSVNDTNMNDDEQIPIKNHNRWRLISYNTAQEMLEYPNFSIDVEEYNTPPFYKKLGNLQMKYESTVYLS